MKRDALHTVGDVIMHQVEPMSLVMEVDLAIRVPVGVHLQKSAVLGPAVESTGPHENVRPGQKCLKTLPCS